MRNRTKVKLTFITVIGISLGLCLLLSPRAEAQQGHEVEVGGDYNFVRTNAPPGGCGCFAMNGGDAWLGYNFSRTLAVVTQISAQTASNIGGTRNLTLSSYLLGARLSPRVANRFVPFMQVLFGAAHAGGSLAPGGFGFPGSHYAFAMTAGGGVDIDINRHFAIRPAEVEYYGTFFDNGVSNRQINLRVSSGIVLRF